MNHTPTPWVSIQKYNPDVAIIGAAQGATAHLATLHAHPDGDLHANADYIVKAVNAHAALVGALEELVHELDICRDCGTLKDDVHNIVKDPLRAARAALALAEKGA